MTHISNADKQARFRKKEHIKREADKIYRLWELSISRWKTSRTPQDVRYNLDKAITLPSSWTEEDYNYAIKKLGQYHLELISSVDQIANDVDGDQESHSIKFRTTPFPTKFLIDNKIAIENAKALATHLISALQLSKCNDADQAAALMEAVRFVGQSLVSNREIHQSQATAICLASIGPQYDRPTWFAKTLADTISKNIDKSLTKEIERYLS